MVKFGCNVTFMYGMSVINFLFYSSLALLKTQSTQILKVLGLDSNLKKALKHFYLFTLFIQMNIDYCDDLNLFPLLH